MTRDKKIWSPFQKAIFKDIHLGEGHTIVEARAGSGKTSSIVEGFRYLPKGKKSIALAFNKSIQKELQEKAPSYVECFTFHSLGFRAIKQRFPGVIIDDYKVFNIVKSFNECKDIDDKQDTDLIFSVCDTVSFCKYGLMDSPSAIDDLIFRFGIDTGEMERKQFISLVIRTLGKDKEDTEAIDFNDMCYFPFVYDLFLGQYDYVFVDERQDLNKSQMVMTKKVCKKDGGRIFATGDTKQELYSWRLSDNSIVQDLNSIEGTKTLSLPISYRCPQKVIELVQPWVPDITCPEGTKSGEINEISLDKMYDVAKPGCFILSRTNAPLIKICMNFIRDNVRANIRGRDVSKQLMALIKKSKKKQVPAFLKWLSSWKDEEVQKLRDKGFNPENVIDRYECLVNLCDEIKDLKEVKDKINDLFKDTDEKNIIILSTVHRAKGLERDNVFLLRWTFKAWPSSEEEYALDEKNEEMNISYVAATRSKDKLFIVNKF